MACRRLSRTCELDALDRCFDRYFGFLRRRHAYWRQLWQLDQRRFATDERLVQKSEGRGLIERDRANARSELNRRLVAATASGSPGGDAGGRGGSVAPASIICLR
jgi:hypothetical protein